MSTLVVDNTFEDPTRRPPLVLGHDRFNTVTDEILWVNESPKPPLAWYVTLVIAGFFTFVLVAMIGYLFATGVGVWGNTNPIMWGFPIVNFVFWVGIGHAGTLISAILFLLRQHWRTAINRFAEAMTIFAVVCAGMFPAIHVGRVWVVYWIFPIPNQMEMWPQFRSPLVWDAFAVGTYFTVSLLFWYVGLIPDLATLRDRATTKFKSIAYGLFSLGWRGSMRHWHRYERAYLLLAALATPLVLSVHSVVSFDFAVAQLPGWHTTIFPPYFVAGAIFSGFAMVQTLAIPSRELWGLKNFITMRHLENMNKIILLTGSMVGYAYIMEQFTAWYSGAQYEMFAFHNRMYGQHWWAYWTMFTCNVIAPQVFWSKRARQSIPIMFIVAILVNIGMWFERFVIILSLEMDFLPSSWAYFSPTWVDMLTLLGSFGLFLTLFLLFIRYLPVIAVSEVKNVMPAADPHHHEHEGEHGSGERDDESEGRS